MQGNCVYYCYLLKKIIYSHINRLNSGQHTAAVGNCYIYYLVVQYTLYSQKSTQIRVPLLSVGFHAIILLNNAKQNNLYIVHL